MPVVQLIDRQSADDTVLSCIFPRREDDGTWVWDEVEPIASPIAGYGLGPSKTTGFPWHDVPGDLPGMVIMPLIGRETEVSSAMEADIFERVLRGVFTTLPFWKMRRALPAGHVWCQRGPYLEAIDRADGREPVRLAADECVVQVPTIELGWLHRGDRDVVYLLKAEIERLLHIPPHIFSLLAMHAKGHHVRRRRLAPHRRLATPRRIAQTVAGRPALCLARRDLPRRPELPPAGQRAPDLWRLRVRARPRERTARRRAAYPRDAQATRECTHPRLSSSRQRQRNACR